MKAYIALLTAAVSSIAAAQPHAGHKHQHLHHAKRNPDHTAYTTVPGPTVIAYVLNGQPISAADVQEGLKNGTLVMADGAPAYASFAPAPTSTWEAPATLQYVPETTSTEQVYSAPTTAAASSPSQAASSSGSGWSDSSSGVDSPFPDGQIDCSTFPSEYGAVAVDWLGLGGWTGIQSGSAGAAGYSNIMTSTSGGCTEGSFCSYACPPGYQKSQWPTTQGSTGQSVGGIQCTNGKLQLTNPSMSSSLCMKGASEVTIQVQNNIGSQVAVCRTDYPGTESETIPLAAMPGTTSPLTCPDADNYYNWEGSHTSAQYYVNPAGVSVEDGCQWGSSANPWGNFAPLNLGVGYSNGAAWLSIFQNAPTTSAQLDFSVEITGDNMSGTCRYQNGQYCGGANYDDCSSTTGCTVSSTYSHFRL